MEDGAGGERSLLIAMLKPAAELAAGGVNAVRTHEPLGSAMLEEIRSALRFGAVPLKECWQRQA